MPRRRAASIFERERARTQCGREDAVARWMQRGEHFLIKGLPKEKKCQFHPKYGSARDNGNT